MLPVIAWGEDERVTSFLVTVLLNGLSPPQKSMSFKG